MKWDTKEGCGKSLHCMYSSMVKGTSQAEATSNSKKIKPVALVIVASLKASGRKGGRQVGRQADRQTGRQAGRQTDRQPGS